LAESFQFQPLNGIKIKDWFGNDFVDRELLNLIPFLKQIAENQSNDVRMELSKYRKERMGVNGRFAGIGSLGGPQSHALAVDRVAGVIGQTYH